MNNNLEYIFGMYIPEKDSVLVNLAEQNPLTYAKLAFKENGLQDYMDTIEEFN